MTMNRTWIVLALAAAMAALACAGAVARADVTAFQNGVGPAADYKGCVDTWISDEQWEKRGYPANPTLVIGGKRHILIKFDLSALPKGAKLNKAVLRLADAGYPAKSKEGKLASSLKAHVLKREWDINASWPEWKRNADPKQPGEAWAAPGGDYDTEADFGQGAGGLLASGAIFDGVFGHAHELDVTEAVRRWHDGKLPNNGLLLRAEDRGAASFASSEWSVPAYRPKLIVDHGDKATGIEPLKAIAGAEVALDEPAQTPDAGVAKGEYAVVCVGQGPNCGLRGASGDSYIKENPDYDGPWGWMSELRIGGAAGSVDRGILYFDLSKLPKDASIKQARLVTAFCGRANLARQYRYGAFLLKLPEQPGWKYDEVTALEAAAGKSWPKGGILACSSDKPVALAKLWQKEVEDKGKKSKIDAGFEFDLTGAVRAWVGGKAPNCGLVLDNRIEGGQYDIYSAKAWQPENRPYLEITLSPGVEAKPEPITVDKSAPAGDYWVEAMKQVHKKFKGKPGTLAQYGDSITITGAFLAQYGYDKKIEPKNCPPEVLAECKVVEKYADLGLWQKWKGRGNTGMMASDWMRRSVVSWQKDMDPEAAVIQFGTNDGFTAPEFAENTAYSMRRIMDTGAVPMLTVPPPKSGQNKEPYRLECISMARALKIPLIDYQGEVLRRRPDDWDGSLPQFKEFKAYQCPTLMYDAHPSNPSQWVNDWSEEGLNKNGYTLRNYMTIRMYYQVISKVFLAKGSDQ